MKNREKDKLTIDEIDRDKLKDAIKLVSMSFTLVNIRVSVRLIKFSPN